MPEKSLIVQRTDGSYIKVKSVDVHAEYVNADGSPRLNSEGIADTGNYVERISEAMLAEFPQEIITGLAQIYDASLAVQMEASETSENLDAE